MQEEQNQNSPKDFSNSDKEIPSVSIEPEETPTNQTKTDNQKNDTTYVNEESNNTMNISQKKDNSAKTANIISVINVGVAATLALFTYLLFEQATKDSKTADKSAKAAQDAVAEQKYNDSINRIGQSRKDSIDSITRKITFASIKSSDSISKETLKQQINSLKETQNEFEIENTPYIECKGFKIFNLEPGQYPIIIFDIINLSNQTEKIINGGFIQYISSFEQTEIDEKRVKQLVSDTTLDGRYVTKDYPITFLNNSSSMLNQDISSKLRNGIYHYYIYGEINYINEVTGRKRKYKFFIKFTNPFVNSGFRIIKNINYNINK